ncbi:MAG: hypothetical protein NWE79_08810 [Candidatus Bathyarchaeota archaeon]|nr:hypothetical protein [Candidatus Bathyarchaeota archaeon]
MSSSPDFDPRIDILDVILEALKEHERELNKIVERIETIFEKPAVSSESGESLDMREESRFVLEGGGDKEGVIFISGRKIMLIPEDELPKVLSKRLSKLAEYELNTPEERSALERLFSALERKRKTGR